MTTEYTTIHNRRMTNEILTEKEVGDLLRVSRSRLATWRSKGGGPAWIKAGDGKAAVRYLRVDVDAWISLHRRELLAAVVGDGGVEE